MTYNDCVIVCGDFGIWHDTPSERWWLDWLAEKPFTVLFVDGNHENFDRLYSNEFEIVDFHCGKAHKIRDNIYHLMRGEVFVLQGKKFFTFGGASSQDIDDGIIDRNDYNSKSAYLYAIKKYKQQGKMFRINHKSWWKEELPSNEEMKNGLENLKKNNFQVDYIITHCLPQSVASIFSMGIFKPDIITKYLEVINNKTKYIKWFCGHYHTNQQIMNSIILYEQIIRVV